MARPSKRPRMSQEAVLDLFRDGLYRLDEDEWVVINRRGKRLTLRTNRGRDESYTKVRLHRFPYRIEIALHKLIWMVTSGRPVPPGCQIHHDDECTENNHPDNLFCLAECDHNKLHRLRKAKGRGLVGNAPEEDIPF